MRDLKLPDQRHPEKAHRPDQEQPKKPSWIRVKAPTSEGYKQTRDILKTKKLATVCEEAACPNVGECWSQGHATTLMGLHRSGFGQSGVRVRRWVSTVPPRPGRSSSRTCPRR